MPSDRHPIAISPASFDSADRARRALGDGSSRSRSPIARRRRKSFPSGDGGCAVGFLEAASGRAAYGWCLLFLFLGLACSATHAGDSVVIFNEIQYHPANEVTQTE